MSKINILQHREVMLSLNREVRIFLTRLPPITCTRTKNYWRKRGRTKLQLRVAKLTAGR